MKFSTQVLTSLNDTLSMKILAGPTRFGDIESSYCTPEGGKDRFPNMVAQAESDPSISVSCASVQPTDHDTTTIDSESSSVLSASEIEDKLRGILKINPPHYAAVASSVGQVNQSSSLINYEHAFMVMNRRNRSKNNAQPGPPRPEGSDAGRATFDRYKYQDAGLYAYRLRGKTNPKSKSAAKKRTGSSGLPKTSVKTSLKTRMRVNGRWTTVIKNRDRSIINAKTGEILRQAVSSPNQDVDLNVFMDLVTNVIDDSPNPNNETKALPALKYAARVLVQAHKLARTPAYHKEPHHDLTQLAIRIANKADPDGFNALNRFNTIEALRRRHNFATRGMQRNYMNNIRQNVIHDRHQHEFNALSTQDWQAQKQRAPWEDGKQRRAPWENGAQPYHQSPTTKPPMYETPNYTMVPRRNEYHPNKFKHHHALMTTTINPENDEIPPTTSPPSPTSSITVRRNDEGGETQEGSHSPLSQNLATITHEYNSDSDYEYNSDSNQDHETLYPNFPPNKQISQLHRERELSLQAMNKWNGSHRPPEIEWIQEYIRLAHYESQANYHESPHEQFSFLLEALSPFFASKGENFLMEHFDLMTNQALKLCQNITPLNVILFALPLQQAEEMNQHYPFYTCFKDKVNDLTSAAKLTQTLIESDTDSASNTTPFPSSINTNTRRKKRGKKKKQLSKRYYNSDSSTSSSKSSSSSSDDSTEAYNSDGNKTVPNMSFSNKRKMKTKQSRKIAKIMKRLHESAKQHHLPDFSVTRGTIDKRKSFFRTWIDTLRQMLSMESRYSCTLTNYPIIDCTNISTTSSMALALFLFTKIEAGSKEQVRSSIKDHLDGIEILQYLQDNFGSTTILDCTKALERLKETTWEHGDTVDTYTSRYLRRAEAYRTTLRSTTSKTKPKLDDVELLTMYLQSLFVYIPSTHPLQHTIQAKFVELEACITSDVRPTFSLLEVANQLRYLESIHLKNAGSARRSYNKLLGKNTSRPTRTNAPSEPPRSHNRANLATQSRKFKPVKCWGCGHHHNLRNCPTTSEEQKQSIYHKKREEKNSRLASNTSRTPTEQANRTATSQQEETKPQTQTTITNTCANNVTEMPRRRGTNFAAPTRHFSGMTKALPTTAHSNEATFRAHALVTETLSLIHEWLIDSGCSIHMTPHIEDFIGEMENCHTMVEVANGGLLEVHLRGTVKMLIVDKDNPENRATVLLKNVLYVPQLSRRLFSVSEWNQCGGQITFMPDKCRIQILDTNDVPIHTIDIDPIYAAEEVNHEAVLTVSKPTAPCRKQIVEQNLLHRRLGHRAISTLLLANEDNVWADVRMTTDNDHFCETCKITTARKANRGSNPLETIDTLVPGMCIMVDIVKNPSSESITSSTYYPFYLTTTDMASRFFVPIGMRRKTSHDVFLALQEWATSYGPGAEFNLNMINRIHGDFDPTFRSEELRRNAAQYNIRISFAAPRHQEQNGIHEANWRNIRNLAFAMMTQARVPRKFFHFAFEHAWKIHAVLPHKALTRTDGTVQTPLGVFEGQPVGIESFRVLFCPVVMTYDSINLRSKDERGRDIRTSYNRQNQPQRGIRGIHVGLPKHNTGYLIYVPQMNNVLHCNDVYFDENFESTLAFTPSRHPAHLDIVITDAPPSDTDEMEHTGSALWFCNKKSSQFGQPAQTFARAVVNEDYDLDVHALQDEHDDDNSLADIPDLISRSGYDSDEEENDNVTTNTVANSSQQTSYPESINQSTHQSDNATDAAVNSSQRYPRRIRNPNPKYAYHAQPTTPIPQEFVETVEQAFNSEVFQDIQNVTDMDPSMFLPAPDNWKQILKLPPHIMIQWSASLLKELKELIKKTTFVIENPNPGDPIIPVTAKFRVKLTKEGLIEKLKSRIALRGDLMRDNVEIPDTWCPIAGFRAFKMFLAMAAHYRKRIYQLDYVAAFLQADVLGRKFTTLPKEWKEMFKNNHEVHQWLGVPLRLNKSLYGDRVANLAWDETQSRWLTSAEIGFERLPSERSIYRKITDKGMIMVLNAVDDQLYFATTPELKEWFEQETDRRFDVQKLGQAEWYLQSRITQLSDYSIILDQSRYAALVAGRYLGPVDDSQIPTSVKMKYASPLPNGTIFSKQDCSISYADVITLQEEFGFEYAAAVGSLIYLMNTFIKLTFTIRKLAKFMQKPGRRHFEVLKHLLNHIQCHRCSAGIKFYSDIKLSPLYQMMIETGNAEHAEAPLILFTDSSFQDCPDTSKSTGGYLLFMKGGVVDNSSHLAGVVCHSSCEAEYCHATSGLMGASFVRKVYNELLGYNSDRPLTIPLGIDSQSAMDTANSHKETSRTRHIARRYHYVRFAQMNSETTLFKVDGTRNPADSMTKALTAEQLDDEATLFHVEVDP
ncbi:reverse transcriptase RNA-dependent DNA polymerase [Nitzschia inconspicua]|uniref:Reverse transcriptase RNA-dependent DNA polymerase n=2 Tax=Nitzschia inconspicua TaxID=303405 RepID=A0A9K3KAY9_9STRA|nr:reverse transcriptase RNA-dependent DNA polymerase [Nitzschia inconspicua]